VIGSGAAANYERFARSLSAMLASARCLTCKVKIVSGNGSRICGHDIIGIYRRQNRRRSKA
jgi:hypothetical protein